MYVRSRTIHLISGFLLAIGVAACSDSPTAVGGPDDKPVSQGPIVTTPAFTSSASNPFNGARLYVDAASPAARQANSWRAARAPDAELMDKIASQPYVDWIGDWFSDVRSAVSSRTTEITNAGALPVFVAYNIPNRDCGSYSAGGASAPAAYRSWIRAFAAGIGTRKAIVILEPDALPDLTCLSATEAAARTELISDAVQVMKAQPNVAVYIDAGNSSWESAPTMIGRLNAAGVQLADGFALNISNFETNANTEAYGAVVSQGLGGKHFVYDTSRNGRGPTNTWCNPDGRGLGDKPSTNTGNPLVDARLWIKYPGESDGTCNGGPAAGVWWPSYAVGLAQRARF